MKRIAQLCEKTYHPALVITSDGRVVNENTAFKRHFKIIKPEISILDYFPNFNVEKDISINESLFGDMLEKGGKSELEFFTTPIHINKDHYWLITFFPEEGEPDYSLDSNSWSDRKIRKDVLLEVDKNLVIRNYSKPKDRVLRIPDEALIGSNLANLFSKRLTIQKFESAIKGLEGNLKGANIHYSEIEDGEQHIFEARINTLKEGRFLIVIKDISLEEENWDHGRHALVKEASRSQEILKNVLDLSTELVLVWESDFTIIHLNKAAQKGLNRGVNLIGTSILQLLPEEEKVSKVMNQQGNGPFRMELKAIDGLGQEKLIDFSVTKTRKFGNEKAVFVGTGKDVTQTKKKKQLLEEQNSRLTEIISQSSKLIMCTIDAQLRITSYNTVFEDTIKQHVSDNLEPNQSTIFDIIENYTEKEQLGMLWNKYLLTLQGIPQQFEIGFTNQYENQIWYEVFVNPLITKDVINEISVFAYDITEKKQQVETQLQEKDMLIKEVHHRVKNNLQVINSLLNIQSFYIEDEEVKMVFEESRNRIKSMSFIHENLYLTKNFSKVDLADYLQQLTSNLYYSYAISKDRVRLRRSFDRFTIGIEQSVPLALIINEIFSNSLKYAFPENKEGEVYIEVLEQGKDILVKVGDNGVGMDESVKNTRKKSLGMVLIKTLSEQLCAETEMVNSNGLHYSFKFEKLKQ